MRRMAAVAAFAVGAGAAAWGHQDDPKALNPMPPYLGPGYTKAAATLTELTTNAALGDQTTAGMTFPANGVELLAWLPLSAFNAGSTGNDCWGYVSASGREYALVGLRAGTAFVDVTTPENPQIVEVIPGPSSLWHDVKVYGDYAYVVSEASSSGIQVIDMRMIDSGVVNLVNTINDVGTGRTHNVAIDTVSGFLYRCGGPNNGLRIYDLALPDQPQFVGQWQDRYVHDAQIVTLDSGPFAGRQLAFLCSGFNGGGTETGFEILDVTDKQNIINLDRVVYPGGAYSHQGWLSPDRQIFYLGDELDEGSFGLNTKTFIFDVSDPANIVPRGFFTNNSSASGHNLYTRGRFLYAANYVSGLRIFDTADPLAPVEVAYFDTEPGADSSSFNSAWSVYPYFPSGTIIVSDMQKGLFVLRALIELAGDVNCDGVISVSDIGPFVTALTNPGDFSALFPDCDITRADMNKDGVVSVSDIGPFVSLLSGQ